ncbi:hypothetical protein [Streptomyces sp. SID4982]|uniref:hypothetical protein n=1 Tax=Streptomyces sp. SID4982 TaxID=2690291 RepID=UPI0013720AC1|nr:hypothetical protein [Streptomyces sp. SID4982]MYS15161.1 hypothetical protein [Streptomyces sp. SID4982]
MPSIYTVTAAGEYWPTPATPCWYVDMLKPDGSQHRHIFPKETLEWRAAEYGIDPTDIEQLLDIVLHEPFAPHPDDPVSGPDPVGLAGLLSPAIVAKGTVKAGDLVPTTLYTAVTTDAAREAHLLRITYSKQERVRVVSPKILKDPLDVIRRNHGVSADGVNRKARMVDEQRAVAQGRRAPTPSPSMPAPEVPDA